MKNYILIALILCCMLMFACASLPSYMASNGEAQAESGSELSTPMPADVMAGYITIATTRHNFSAGWLRVR